MRTAYVVHRPVVNRYLVRERDRRRLRELARVLVAALAVALALIAYVWVNLERVHTGYRIHELESRLWQVRHELRLLELEESYLTGAARLESRAAELGLSRPAPGQQRYLEEDR